MPHDNRAPFVFGRDWTHARVTYTKGDPAELPANDVEKLTRLGAGALAERKTDPPKGKKAPTPSL